MGAFDGRVVLVTGASRGIGEAAAVAFAEEGASVGLLARSAQDLERVASRIDDRDRTVVLPCDVADAGMVGDSVTRTVERFGRLDVLVNNAGVIQPIAPIHEAAPDEWRTAIEVNVLGVHHGIRAAAPVMVEQGEGTIITISSGAARRPLEGWSAYCTSKAAAAMITDAAHLELDPLGLRVMGLRPGTVATDMQREIRASGVNRVSELDWEEHVPPEWVGRTLVWMAGPAGDELRGTEVSLRDDDVRRAVGLPTD